MTFLPRARWRELAAALAAGIGLLVGCGTSDTGGVDLGPQPAAADASSDGSASTDASASSPADASTDAGAKIADGGSSDASKNPCAPLTFPSGVVLETFEDAAMTATYTNHLGSGEKAPTCFLDVQNLVEVGTGKVLPITVSVATNFTLDELVGTEVAQGYGHLVVMSPDAVASLQKFRAAVGVPVSVTSGFRGPKHQEDVCNSLCGNPLGCPGTCANNSRHMFGDAFDLPLAFYTKADEQLACDAGFKFAYLESGTHLHIDQNPAYATCVIQ